MLVPLLCTAALAAPLRPADVPSPRLHDGWVSDLAGVVDEAQEQQIDNQVTALQAELGAELAVVTVSEVEGTPKAFATELFNLWGIGDADANNGVLVLLVVDARRVEIETGYGVEGILNDGWLGRMMDDAMVPAFKAGDLGEGLVAGVDAIDDRLRAHPEETRDGTGSAVPVGEEPEVDVWPHGLAAWAVGLSAASPGFIVLGLVLAHRRRRRCPICKRQMDELSEAVDDAHLDEGQREEEQLGSVDYEVRVCPQHEIVVVIPKNRWGSGYVKCPSCGYRTSTRDTVTLVSATYTSGGEVEVTVDCRHCGHHAQSTHATPVLTRSSSSSSGGGYSGGSGFGGGSSGGGGAGRSW